MFPFRLNSLKLLHLFPCQWRVWWAIMWRTARRESGEIMPVRILAQQQSLKPTSPGTSAWPHNQLVCVCMWQLNIDVSYRAVIIPLQINSSSGSDEFKGVRTEWIWPRAGNNRHSEFQAGSEFRPSKILYQFSVCTRFRAVYRVCLNAVAIGN